MDALGSEMGWGCKEVGASALIASRLAAAAGLRAGRLAGLGCRTLLVNCAVPVCSAKLILWHVVRWAHKWLQCSCTLALQFSRMLDFFSSEQGLHCPAQEQDLDSP